MTECAALPADWQSVRLGNLGVFFRGSGIKKDEAQTGFLPAVRYGEIYTDHGEILKAHRSHISSDVAKTARLIQHGDILFASSGETKEEIGKCVGFLGDYEAFAGGDIVVFRPSGVNPVFLAYALNSYPVAIQKSKRAQGDAVVHIYPDALSSIELGLPPPKEQQAIAEALSDADALIEGLDRLIAKKRLIKQGAMQDLLTARRRLPGFSGEWVQTTFGQCFQFLRTGSAARSQLGSNLGIGYIHYGDIHGMKSAVLDLTRTRLPEIAPGQVATLSRVQEGDLVIADASEDLMDVGKAVEIRGIGTTEVVAGLHTFLLRGNPDILADGFKAYIQFLRDVRAGIESIATGSSVYGISKKNLAALRFRVPPVEEQAAIGQVFGDMDAEIQALETRLDKARQIKEGMMQNLLTGRIRLV